MEVAVICDLNPSPKVNSPKTRGGWEMCRRQRDLIQRQLNIERETQNTNHFIRYTSLVSVWTPFCVNLIFHAFNKVLETFLRDSGLY